MTADELSLSVQRSENVVQIDLRDWALDIAGAKRTLLCFAVLGFIAAITMLLITPRSYTATAVVGPAQTGATGGLSSALGSLSAATGLGISGAPESPDFVKFAQLLTSERLATSLYGDKRLRADLFPGLWDPKKQNWTVPTGLLFETKMSIRALLGRPNWHPPSPFDFKNAIAGSLNIIQDKVTGYMTLNMQGSSPNEAEYALGEIIATSDSLIRQSIKNRSAGRIVYLNSELLKTTQQDQRDAILTILSSEEKTMMMTAADQAYSVDSIDPPAADTQPTSPKVIPTILGYSLFAAFFVMLWAVARGQLRRTRYGLTANILGLDGAIWSWVREKNGYLCEIFGRINPLRAHRSQ